MPVLTGIPRDNYLLMHFDTGVADANIPLSYNIPVAGSATISSVTSKFGGKSLLLNGYGSLELQNVSIFNFGSSDFSISMWVHILVNPSATAFFKTSAKLNNYAGALIGYNGVYNYFSSQGTSWDVMNAVSFGAIPLNTWTHIEVNRNSDKITTHINGVIKSTNTIPQSASIYYNSTEPVVIGKHSSNSLVAYIDELLVVKGQSLHNGIDNFTPPVDQYVIIPRELGEFDGSYFGESEIGERSSVKQGFEFGELSAEGQLTRQIRRAIRVEQLEGVGTLSRPVRAARRIEQLMGVGDRTQGDKKLNDEFLGEFLDLGPRSAERSGTDLESLDSGNREIAYREGNEAFLLESADREAPNRNGFDIESFDFDSNAVNKFNLTVTPTHQYKSRIVEIKADLLEQSPSFGQYSLSINGDEVVPFSSIDDSINTILINVSQDKFITGNNLCRLRILRQNGDKEHLDFEVFKEEPKRTQVERLFRSYEGGYDGERMNAAVTLKSAYPSFLPPRDQLSTLIKTTEFTRIPLAKYLAVQGVNIDAQGARILVSFDEGLTWKTWGVLDYAESNTGVKVTPNLISDSFAGYTVTGSPEGSGYYYAYRAFDGYNTSTGNAYYSWYPRYLTMPAILTINLPKYEIVNGYSMSGYDNAAYNAKSWRIEGSPDVGTTWEVLDTQINQTLTYNVKNKYSFPNKKKYNAFRLVVTADTTGAGARIPELELFSATPIYGWKDVNLEDIAEEGMSPEVINSRTLADWATIFKSKNLDFAIYLDDRLSNYYDLSTYPQELIGTLSYWGFPASFQTYNIPDDKIVTTTTLQRWNNESVGTYGRAFYVDYSYMLATPGNSSVKEFPVIPSKDVKFVTLETPNTTGSGYAVGATFSIYGTRRISYLKSINVQITPNLKTGYAFII